MRGQGTGNFCERTCKNRTESGTKENHSVHCGSSRGSRQFTFLTCLLRQFREVGVLPSTDGEPEVPRANLLTGIRSKVQRGDQTWAFIPPRCTFPCYRGTLGRWQGISPMSQGGALGTQLAVGVTSGAARMWTETIISFFPVPPMPFSSPSACWCTRDIYFPENGKVPPMGSWEVTGSENERTAARGMAPRPHLKTQHHFHHCRDRYHAGAQNAG